MLLFVTKLHLSTEAHLDKAARSELRGVERDRTRRRKPPHQQGGRLDSLHDLDEQFPRHV